MNTEIKYWVDLFFICYFILLGLLIAVKLAIWLFTKKQYQATVKKATLIKAVLQWCAKEMGYPAGHRKLPELEISYYRHQKLHGFFNFYTRKIKIYPKNHDSVTSLINTVIHEYIHFLEVTNKESRNLYNKFHHEAGYDKNPYEVSARKKAEQYTPACVKYLTDVSMLRKVNK